MRAKRLKAWPVKSHRMLLAAVPRRAWKFWPTIKMLADRCWLSMYFVRLHHRGTEITEQGTDVRAKSAKAAKQRNKQKSITKSTRSNRILAQGANKSYLCVLSALGARNS